ncbi:MAG: glycosyltransferase family 2 protein, partial [Chloroflexota bacterium]|nr:glycosyltransferase family 2 protein [Chloroflexota bacterium]
HYRHWPRVPIIQFRPDESEARPLAAAARGAATPDATPHAADTAPDHPRRLPVSVVVPARDEAENLKRLLPALICLDPPPAEVLVVDDRSTDGTGAVAAGFGMRVLGTTEPPAGWSGKNWACRLGAEATTGAWLLFTDADTWHAPASLGAALAVARRDDADLLSLFPAQECRSIWERLVLPFAFGQFFAAIGPHWANDDRAPSAIANGQYLLIGRDLYERIGGHGAVRASLGEDVELARLARRAGGRVRVYRGEHLVRVRMYRTLGGIQTGFRKYMTGYLTAYPPHGALIGLATAVAGLPLIRLVQAALGRGSWRLAGASCAVGVLGFLPWVRWFGIRPLWALLQPLAYAVFQVVALDAGLRSVLGVRVTWKGRRYRLTGP